MLKFIMIYRSISKSNRAKPSLKIFIGNITWNTKIDHCVRFIPNINSLQARRAIGDFGVPIAIFVMVIVDVLIKSTYTEKLDVPDGFEPTDSKKRDWFINPMGVDKDLPVWAIFAAAIPALLVFILIFMETMITK